MASSLKGQTLFITGASRGIGLAIALRAAKDGANIAIVAKTTKPHPSLPGTIYTAAEDVEAAGGRALPIACDIRDTAQIEAAVAKCVEHFGGIDIVINNASAIRLTDTPSTTPKWYDLMHSVNARGTFFVSRAAIPHLRRSSSPAILMLSPPIGFEPDWYGPHLAYATSKMGMSMAVLGLSAELASDGIAVNALWPRMLVATAALQAISAEASGAMAQRGRIPAIVADAAYAILTDPQKPTGRFFIDEQVLRDRWGVADFGSYSVVPGSDLLPDLFVPARTARARL